LKNIIGEISPDSRNFDSFYKKISRPFWLYVFSTCADEGLADEIFQESFCRFLRKAPYQLNDHQKKAYLYKIASRLFIDHKRRIKKEMDSLKDLDAFQPKYKDSPHALDMQKVFILLKPKERKLLWLAYVEGYEHKEIAKILGAGEKSIKVLLYRAKKSLTDLLEKKGYNRLRPDREAF
jgi:RNA polymerase sigma-70 factor (ECF subfamily)